MNHQKIQPPGDVEAAIPAVQIRILRVFEEILQKGPINLEKLQYSLPIPKTSIHRSLQNLISAGWVQKSLGRGGYVVSFNMLHSADTMQFGFPHIEDAQKQADLLDVKAICHLDFLIVRSTGHVLMCDSTDPEQTCFSPEILTQSLAAQVAVGLLAPVERLSFLRKYLSFADAGEAYLIKTPDFVKKLNFSNRPNMVLSQNPLEISVGWKDSVENIGALRIRPKSRKITECSQLQNILDNILQDDIEELTALG